MKKANLITLVSLILLPIFVNGQVKDLLISQLKTTHSQKAWFEPSKGALRNLNSDQVVLKDSTTNHSIRELASHILFWTETNLKSFKGEQTINPSSNEVTFTHYDALAWDDLVAKLDSAQSQWEVAVQEADESYLTGWAKPIANMCTHTAYHTGQIMYIRKKNGWW